MPTKGKATEMTMKGNAEEILKKPYARVLVPDPAGGYAARILEFPGCFSQGESAAEALSNLEEAAANWVSAALEQGLSLPEPAEALQSSGRVALRLPRSLHASAAACAEREGVSLNQLVVYSLAERVGATRVTHLVIDRLAALIGEIATNLRVSPNAVSFTGEMQNRSFAPIGLLATSSDLAIPC